MYITTTYYTPINLAALWYKEQSEIPVNWKEELTQWFYTWVEENHAETRNPQTSSLCQYVRTEVINSIETQAREKAEKRFRKQNRSLKRGMLNAYIQSEQYLIDQKELLAANSEYQMLLSDTEYENSSAYQDIYSVLRTKELEMELKMVLIEAQKMIETNISETGIEELESIDICSAVEAAYAETGIFQRMEIAMSQGGISWITQRHPSAAKILTILDTYREHLLNDGMRTFMYGHNTIIEYVCSKILQHNKQLKKIARLSGPLKYNLMQRIENETQLTERFRNDLNAFLAFEHMYELFLQNPHYNTALEAALQRKRAAEVFQQQLQQYIPNSYEYLYPKARSMFRHFILHIGPTNSGKTWSAMKAFREAESAVYLAPLRLLAHEAYEESNRLGCSCNLTTGEEETYIEEATHTACTIEMLDFDIRYDVCVIDEAQMLSNEERGGAWTAAILGVQADVIHICAAPNAEELIIKLIELCSDTYEVERHKRRVPLALDISSFVFPSSVRKYDALIVFSKRNVLYVAAELQSRKWKVSVIYGALPYEARQREVQRFINGETDVIVATDAIGMGMNLPIKRIVFLETQKFDGSQLRDLSEQEVKQIAGRAGRQGIFDVGYFTSEFSRNWFYKQLKADSKPVKKAYVSFPETLLAIPGSLSELLTQWNNIAAKGFLRRTSHKTEIELAKQLEAYTDDKHLIYAFVTMPFEERYTVIKNMWLRLFRQRLAQMEPPSYIEEYLLQEEQFSLLSLEQLEMEYRKCDLLYIYLRKFEIEFEKEEVIRHKKLVAELISKELSTQKLPPKKCSRCGKILPWNFPYDMCGECHGE